VQSVLRVAAELLAAGGGGAAVAWAIFAKFGDRWLEQRFAVRMEEFKHAKTTEIENLRHSIASLFSRISKVHEKEFEVLPTAWFKLHDAYGKTFRVISSLKQFPVLNDMSTAQLEEFVGSCRLPKFRKSELLQAANRDEYYQRWIFWSDFAAAQTAHTESRNYFVLNRIFMTNDLQHKFSEIDKLLMSVLIAAEITHQTPSAQLHQKLGEDFTKIEPLLAPLEKAIQERLRYEEA
jgi:hypothetical protein